uniref:TMC domain-containing protein n=1 Tax=Parastrongyloides trichosuri TaxID=131310 RepID=A0A0N4ZPC3_PARTI
MPSIVEPTTTNILNKNTLGAVLKSSLVPGALVRSGSIFREPSPTPSYNILRQSPIIHDSPIRMNNSKDTNIGSEHGYYSRRGSLAFANAKRRLSGMYSNSTQGIQQSDLCERSSSKLTLDEELFDILHAFGESDLQSTGGVEKKEGEGIKENEIKPSTRQNLLDRIKQKREVINKLRCQPWDMNRKRRTLRLAQKYLEQNESKVSRTHAIKEELTKAWFKMKRWFSNIHTYFIPWESKIKKIESHFGSVVSSYFTFLRWIVFINLVITVIIIGFIVIPEVLADAAADNNRKLRTASRKLVPSNEINLTTKLQVVWQYDGYLKHSPLFYGYYSDDKYVGTKVKYALPLAYFVITLLVFGYSFFAILRKMAANARLSKMAGSKSEQYIFNWKVFTGWDYTIGNSETASNSVMAVVIKLRESIAESKIQQEHQLRWLQVVTRVIANAIILGMLGASIYIIAFAVQSSGNTQQNVHDDSGNLLSKNQLPSIVATITHVFPMIFDLIGKIENYHPRTALRAHLARVLVLYVLNYMTLIFALFEKLDNIREASVGGTNSLFDDMPLESEMFLRVRRQMGGVNKQLGKFTAAASRSSPRRNFTWRAFMNYMENTVVPIIESGEVEKGNIIPVEKDNNTTEINFITAKSYVTHPKGLSTTTLQTSISLNSIETTTNINNDIGNETTIDKDIAIISGLRAYQLKTTTEKIKFKSKKLQPIKPLPTLKTIYVPQIKKFPTTTRSPRAGQWKGRKTKNPKYTTQQPRVVKYNKTIENERNKKYKTALIFPKQKNNTSTNKNQENLVLYNNSSDHSEHICWETMIGQEIVRLVTMDLYITIASIFVIDFIRGLWVRYCSSFWCWDLESTFPEYGEFKVAENVLHIINNQGMIWLGLFFAPLLPAINNIKLIILMYIRGWTVMTCNVPASEIFRASRSSNFYLMVLLLWLLLCTLPVGYVIASKKPSTNCGPFAGSDHFYKVITNVLEEKVDPKLLKILRYVVSPGVIIPIMLVLFLTIYFLVSLVRGLREANSDLQQQLVHERTEEKKKIFELAGGGAKKKGTFFNAFKNGTTIFPGEEGNNVKRKKTVGKEKLKIHVCDLEEKRREPWRQYNGTANDDSLIPKDERDEINDLKKMPTPPSSREENRTNVVVQQNSNNENNISKIDSTNIELQEFNNNRVLGKSGQRYSVVIPLPHRNIHLGENNIDDDDVSSITSEINSSKKNYPQSYTPDDVKCLMKNFQSAEYLNNVSTGLSLASFPTVLSNSNFSTNDLTVVFQSTSGRENPSRSASIKIGGSITSLDTPRIKSLLLRKNSISCRNLEESKRNVNKNVEELIKKSEEIKDNNLRKNVALNNNVVETFQPWPSIEEVKNKRANLQPVKKRIKGDLTDKLVSTVPMRKKNIFSRPNFLFNAFSSTLLGKYDDDKIQLTLKENDKSYPNKWKIAPRVEFGEDDSPRVVSSD